MGVRVPPPAPIVDIPNPSMSRPVLISGLLGINCWVTCAAMPAWHLLGLGALSSWVLVVDVLALLGLAVGVLALWRRSRASAIGKVSAD